MSLSEREIEEKPVIRRLFRRLFGRTFSWLLQTHIEVDASCPPLLDESDGNSFQSMLDGSIKKPFKQKRNQFVYCIDTPTGTFYLKRTVYQTPRSILRHLLRRHRAHTDSGWEYLAVRALQAHGFRVMQTVAFGEQHWLGLWPRRGFLLVREVLGEELAVLLSTKGDATLRCEAFSALGHYIGRLHGSGFFHVARVHDFICDRTSDDQDCGLRLTMIDVDFKGLLSVPRLFDAGESIEALAESCYLFLRVSRRANTTELSLFFRGYKSGLRNCGQKLPPRSLNALAAAVTRRLKEHAQDSDRQAMFPETPASLADAFLKAREVPQKRYPM